MDMLRGKWGRLKAYYEDLTKIYFVAFLSVSISFLKVQPLLEIVIGCVSCFAVAESDSILVKLRRKDREAWRQYGRLIQELRHD